MDQAVYALGGTDKNYFVQKYDPSTLALMESKKMDIPEIGGLSKIQIEQFFMMRSSLIVLFSGVEKSTGTVEVHAYKVKPDCTLDPNGKLVLSVPIEKKKNLGDVGIEYNPEINQVMIYHHFRSKATDAYQLTVVSVDEGLSDITSGSYTLPITKGYTDYKLLDVLLSDDGHIYAIDNNIDAGDEENWKYKKQELHLVSFKKQGNSFKADEEVLNLGANYYITDGMLYDLGKKLSVTGFYVDLKNGKGNELDGCFNARIADGGKLEEPVTFSFTEEFKNKFDTRTVSRVRLQGSMKIHEAHTIGGSTYVVAENFYLTDDVPVYDNMLIYKISDGKEISWAQALPKRQSYVQVALGMSYGAASGGLGVSASAQFNLVSADNGNYLSYYCWAESDQNLYVLFNDSKRNAEVTGEGNRKWLLKPQDGVPMIATITSTGSISYEVESSMQVSDVPLRPKYSLLIDDKLYFVSGKKSAESLSSARLQH